MKVLDFVSEERLATYLTHTDSEKTALALHNHTLQLGSSLMSMIALLELSLRNTTNLQLIATFGDEEWLLPDKTVIPLKKFERDAVSSAQSQARKAVYAKLSFQDKKSLDARAFPGGVPQGMSQQNVVKRRQSLFQVSHGQIITQTSFSFWKRLYSADYEHDLWKPSIKRVFPNKALKRTDISRALEVVYATRNRVAHHEPVYGARLDDAMLGLRFLRDSIGARGADDDSAFKRFSRVQFLRLQMDYESFTEAWHTLT